MSAAVRPSVPPPTKTRTAAQKSARRFVPSINKPLPKELRLLQPVVPTVPLPHDRTLRVGAWLYGDPKVRRLRRRAPQTERLRRLRGAKWKRKARTSSMGGESTGLREPSRAEEAARSCR